MMVNPVVLDEDSRYFDSISCAPRDVRLHATGEKAKSKGMKAGLIELAGTVAPN